MAISLLSAVATLAAYCTIDSAGAGWNGFRSASLSYDFPNFVYGNSDLGSCAAGSATCANVLANLVEVYGLEYANFSYPGTFHVIGNSSTCTSYQRECMPLRVGGNFSVACLVWCGG